MLAYDCAAHLWGLIGAPPDSIDVIVGTTIRRQFAPAFVRVHRQFVPRSAVEYRDGLPVTSRAWTVVDQLGALPRVEAFMFADRALQRSWIRRADLEARLTDFPGRTGNTQIAAIHRRTGDGAAAESERLLHRILRRAGVTGWVANHPVWFDGALVAVIDVALPERRLAIEVDGFAFHSDVERFQRDRQRQNQLIGLGWTVVRFTWADLTTRPGYVAATIARSSQVVAGYPS